MDYEWTVFFQEKVREDTNGDPLIPFPDNLYRIVGNDDSLHGPSVRWNFETNANFLVLSKHPLRGSNYQEVKQTKIYDFDVDDDRGGRIRIPRAIDKSVRSHFLAGTRVNYMAYREMVEQDNPSVFLLSNSQFQQLLPSGAQQSMAESDDGEELQQSLLNLPAFLPAP